MKGDGGGATVTRAVAPFVVVGAAAAMLFWLPPAQYGFYPECPVYRYLHLLCPGCGSTRAVAALLHGRVNEAMRLNGLTTLMVPMAMGYAVRCYGRFLRREPLHLPKLPDWTVYGGLVVAVAFTVIRNVQL